MAVQLVSAAEAWPPLRCVDGPAWERRGTRSAVPPSPRDFGRYMATTLSTTLRVTMDLPPCASDPARVCHFWLPSMRSGTWGTGQSSAGRGVGPSWLGVPALGGQAALTALREGRCGGGGETNQAAATLAPAARRRVAVAAGCGGTRQRTPTGPALEEKRPWRRSGRRRGQVPRQSTRSPSVACGADRPTGSLHHDLLRRHLHLPTWPHGPLCYL